MITVDLHSHTLHSHGKDTTQAMAAAAFARGFSIFGFSEHSLRPAGYRYGEDYQMRLAAGFPAYIREVREERERYAGRMTVLLGLEMDYMPEEEAFAREAAAACPYDYVIGGLHFLDSWGFDGSVHEWNELSAEGCHAHFAAYYRDMAQLAASGIFHMVSHPDLIKLFRVDSFHAWLERAESRALVREALAALQQHGLAMEISSAALRKGLGEPYPGPVIMEIARELDLPVFFGSDAHAADQVGHAFDRLEAYARHFGYTSSVYHVRGVRHAMPFA